MGGDVAVAQGWPPTGSGSRQRELRGDAIGDAREQLVLVGEVLVQGHRLDAELLSQAAHRDRREPLAIGEVDGGVEDPVTRQPPGSGTRGSRFRSCRQRRLQFGT